MASVAKPRLILNNCENDPRRFEAFVKLAAPLKRDFDVRIVISHLARPRWEEWPDREDPYPAYFACFPTFIDFVPHPTLRFVQHAAFVRGNARLLRAKAAILKRHGLGGAFVGQEPVYLRQRFYDRYPNWRGPRVDHPRRSREALFAPCLHLPAVQALYAELAAALVKACPAIDTFYFPCTNDSGAGFCHYPPNYFGPNGPDHCRGQGPAPAVAAFHRAILDGAKSGGARDALTLMGNAARAWNPELMPAGAHHVPAPPRAAGAAATAVIEADLTQAYPIRYLADPLQLIERTAALPRAGCAVIALWFSDCYNRQPADTGSAARRIRLFHDVWCSPDKAASLPRRLATLETHLAAEFGLAAARAALDGFVAVHESFRLQAANPMRLRASPFPMYGSVSHRWLTRPLLAVPDALPPDDEREFLKFVFSAFGLEGRRNLLDLHGKLAINPAGDYDQFSPGIDAVIAPLETAAARFASASQTALRPAAARTLALLAKASRALSLVWRNCKNTLEFAALRENATVGPPANFAAPVDKGGGDLGWLKPYHKIVFRVLRNELDVIDALLPLVARDGERVVGRASKAALEDPLLLGPDLAGQLTRKRAAMLRHWQDVLRLEPLAERPFTFTYW